MTRKKIMTIEREGLSFMVECDKCSNYELVDTEFFDSMIREIKEKGWRISKGKYDEWKHICPVCAEGGRP
jgi:hypothetical protein